MTALAPYGWWLDGHPGGGLLAASTITVNAAAGTYYWEVTLVSGTLPNGFQTAGVAFGVANSSSDLTDTCDAGLNLPQVGSTSTAFTIPIVDGIGNGSTVWGYPSHGPTGFPDTHNALAAGQVYSLALNTLTHRLWWRAATGADTRWNTDAAADPVTGTLGLDISASGPSPVLGNVFPLLGATNGCSSGSPNYDTPSVGTVNFGATAFAGTPPTGYVSPYSIIGAVATLDPGNNGRLTLSNGNLTFTGTHPIGVANQGNMYDTVRARFSFAQAP